MLISRDEALAKVFDRLAAAEGHRHVTVKSVDEALEILSRRAGPSRAVLLDEACCRAQLGAELGRLSATGQAMDRTFVLANSTFESRILSDGGSNTPELMFKPFTRAKLRLLGAPAPPLGGQTPESLREGSGETDDGRRRVVLVVEDNPTNQYVVRKTLERLGCTVEVAGDGIDAVDAAERQPFDLILMDLQMPRLDGIAATRRIRSQPGPNQHTPIFAITANAFTDDVQRCLDAGMNGHLSKPLRRQALAAIVEKVPLNELLQPELNPGAH
jgi:CheY-like chemotaxis protein